MRRVIAILCILMCLFSGVALAAGETGSTGSTGTTSSSTSSQTGTTVTYKDADGNSHTVTGYQQVNGQTYGSVDGGPYGAFELPDGAVYTSDNVDENGEIHLSAEDYYKDTESFKLLNELDGKFNEAASEGISALRGPVYATALILGTISLASNWTLYEGQLRISFIIETILKTAFFLWIISLWGSITAAIGDTFVQAGTLAAMGSTDAEIGKGTGEIVKMGFVCVKVIWQDLTLVNAIAHPIDSIMRVIGIFCVLVGYLLLAFEMLVTRIEWNVFRCLSMMFIPFGLLRMTSSFFSGVIKGLFSYGAKLMVVTFLSGLIFKFTKLTATTLGKESTTADTVILGFVFLVLAWIVRSAGALASSLVSGSPSLSGAGLKSFVGGAATGVGGAVIGAAAVAATGGTAAVAQAAAGGAGASAAGAATASGFSMSQFTAAMTNGVFSNMGGGSMGSSSLGGSSSDSSSSLGGGNNTNGDNVVAVTSGSNNGKPTPNGNPNKVSGTAENYQALMSQTANNNGISIQDNGKIGTSGADKSTAEKSKIQHALGNTLNQNGGATGDESAYNNLIQAVAEDSSAAEAMVNGKDPEVDGSGGSDGIQDVKEATNADGSPTVDGGEPKSESNPADGKSEVKIGEPSTNEQQNTSKEQQEKIAMAAGGAATVAGIADINNKGNAGAGTGDKPAEQAKAISTNPADAKNSANAKDGKMVQQDNKSSEDVKNATNAGVVSTPSMSERTKEAKAQMDKAMQERTEAANKVLKRDENGNLVANENATKADKERFVLANANYNNAKENFLQQQAVDTANQVEQVKNATNDGAKGADGVVGADGKPVNAETANVDKNSKDARGGMQGTGQNVELTEDQKKALKENGVTDEALANMRKLQQEDPARFAYLMAANNVLDEKGKLKEGASPAAIDSYMQAKSNFEASEKRKAEFQEMMRQEQRGSTKETQNQQSFGRKALRFTGTFTKELGLQAFAMLPGVDTFMDMAQAGISRRHRLSKFGNGDWYKYDNFPGQMDIYQHR